MSKTFRKRYLSKSKGKTLHFYYHYHNKFEVDDSPYIERRAQERVGEDNKSKVKKAAKSIYHSDGFLSVDKTYKKFIQNYTYKKLRQENKVKLDNFIKTGDIENFDDVIDVNPISIAWMVT